MPRPRLKLAARIVGVLFLLFALVTAGLVANAWESFGAAPDGERRARLEASPQWDGEVFVNPDPMWNDIAGSVGGMFHMSPVAEPDGPIPVLEGTKARFAEPPTSGLRITWLGHSTQIIEIDGVTVITDPIFGGRASPWTWLGPAAWYEPPIPLTELPPLDAVLLSHDHYDHLQIETIQAMASWDVRFIAPLGVGAHLEAWGVPTDRITEVDWWDRVDVGGVELVAVPARHASGRQIFDQNRTLWTGFALLGTEHRVLFSGDTGCSTDCPRSGASSAPST